MIRKPAFAFTLAAFASICSPASADSTNAAPVIREGGAPLDVAALPWIGEETRTYVADLSNQYQTGQIAGFVVAASPNGNWGVRTAAAGSPEVSLADMARQALEQCEYFYVMPCRLVAVNNQTQTDAAGGWAEQPYLLSPDPARFDFTRIPFVNEKDRYLLRDYAFAANPRAMAVSDSGWWSWKTGATMAEAITLALGDCKTGNGDSDCYLYAVNDFVVIEFER